MTDIKIDALIVNQEKKLDNPSLYECVKNLLLRHQWSPEQISSRLKFENSSFH